MPNYVRNVLVFLGEKEKISNVMEFMKGANSLVDMEKILPLPQGNIDTHQWKISNWGSTDAVDCVKNKENIVSFSTSWSPPLRVIEALANKFPELDIRYYWANEDIGADSGMQLWEDGQMIEEDRAYNLLYNYCWDTLAKPA